MGKPQLALYIGGMGAKGQNFYHNLATRYGYGEVADRIQELYLAGSKHEAIAAVPDELVRECHWSARADSSPNAWPRSPRPA